MRARVAVVACRDRLAEPFVAALRRSPDVESVRARAARPASDRRGGVQPLRHASSVRRCMRKSPSHRSDLTLAREVCARLASLPLKQAIVLVERSGLLAESSERRTAATSPRSSRKAQRHRRRLARGRALAARRSASAAVHRRRLHTILRPAAVLDSEDYFSRLLTGRVAMTYPGHDPTIQLLSTQDLAGAVAAIIEHRACGTYNVAPAAGIPLKAALQVAGVPRLPLGRMAQNAVRHDRVERQPLRAAGSAEVHPVFVDCFRRQAPARHWFHPGADQRAGDSRIERETAAAQWRLRRVRDGRALHPALLRPPVSMDA